MADKRMFTKEITESDDFLDLPHSTRCLYYDLNLNADDDGFVNSPNKVMRISGATKDDLNLLIEKRFILSFDNNVICVKHWLMHNTLKKDRYKSTKYQEYLATLEVKDNGAYTEKIIFPHLEPERNQIGTETEPERNRSIDKYSIDEKRKEEKAQQIADLFNSLCPSFSKVKVLSDSMKTEITKTLAEFSESDISTAFEKAEQSSFLKGKNERKWKASFDWLIKAENIAKVLNGNFDDKKEAQSNGRSYDLEAWERMSKEKSPVYARNNPDVQARADALKQQLTEGSV